MSNDEAMTGFVGADAGVSDVICAGGADIEAWFGCILLSSGGAGQGVCEAYGCEIRATYSESRSLRVDDGDVGGAP